MKVLRMGKTSHLTYWHLMLRELPQKRDLAVIGFFLSDKREVGVLCNPNFLRHFNGKIFLDVLWKEEGGGGHDQIQIKCRNFFLLNFKH